MPGIRRLAGFVAAALAALGLWQLESARSELSITPLSVGETPATIYRQPDASGPAVIIAHGFAGSRQLMEAYALTLARAGYVVISFDFEGHGRNPVPMSGDVTSIDGTTRLLIAETKAVIDAAAALPYVTGPVALLGHSMASDIIIRQAIADRRIAAVVAISVFSEAITASEPKRLLMINGEWETRLRQESLKALRLVNPDAAENGTVSSVENDIVRRAVAAPRVEHIGVLYSGTALREARGWLDIAFGRESTGSVAMTGGWIALLLFAIVLLAWPLAALLPKGETRAQSPSRGTFLTASLVPAIVTPLLLYPADTRILPVLVADYMALHLLIYGLFALAILRWRGVRFGRLAILPALTLVVFGIGVFGLALDRYVASFVPHAGRIPIILAMAVGAVPFMLADSLLTEGGAAPFWRRLAARAVFLASLGLAVALDFEGLFFLLIIMPIIILFFLIFGLMGGWVGRRTGAPMASGLALGLILAWALGVSFPLFSA